jgi:hypothetical protein
LRGNGVAFDINVTVKHQNKVMVGVNLSPQQQLLQQQNSTVIGNSSNNNNSSSSNNVVMGPQLPFANNWNNSSYNNSSSSNNNNNYQLIQLEKFELEVHPLELIRSIKQRYNCILLLLLSSLCAEMCTAIA